jgi:hypothetical protein
MNKIDQIVEVYKGDVDPNDWGVWGHDPIDNSAVQIAVFSGRDAEARAMEYAQEKYSGFERCEPDRST